MARTGRFGRMPRQPSSLTNTLVAIAREYQNQRAQNIMDAWQKGGEFEGKKATDSLVLAFWKDRMAGVSKDDPLYDTYKNAHTQLDYTIHESKMTAAYAQHKVSDAAMVNFYLGWAKKVPKDSEFYRVLQRDAGQYMRTNQANAKAEEARRKEERYQKQQADTQKQFEAAGEYTIDVLRRIAQSGNVAQGIAPAISAPGSGSGLTDFDPSDPGLMLRLIAAVAPQGTKELAPGVPVSVPDGEFKGTDQVLYYDDDKKPVTGADVMKQLQKLDPGYVPGTPFDVNYVTNLMDRQMQGLNERIDRAKKTGHMTDVSSLQKSKGYVALLNREVAAYPIQKAYQEARADYDAIVGDKSSSPQAVLNAWQTYQSTLLKLSNDPRIVADDNTRSRLIAEANMQGGVPTLNESFTGLANGQYDASSAKDIAENKAGIEYMQAQVDAVKSGSAMWTYGERDSNGVFVPKAGGRELGAATQEAIQAGGTNAQVLTIDDPLGGPPMQVVVTAVPVYATAKNPQTGEPLSASNANPIAYAYDLPKGSGTETQYGFMTNEGFVFSSDPPWDNNLKTTSSSKGGNHIEVDLTPEVARAFGYGEQDPITGQYAKTPDLTTDQDMPGGFHVRGTGQFDDQGNPKPGQIVFDPQAAAWSTDTRNALGSTDPMTDFKSLTLSTLMSDEAGRTILTNLDKNPAFKTQLDNDNLAYAGAQRDPKTGAYLPETADPAKLAAAAGQTQIASQAKSFVEFIQNAAKTWQRVTTGSPYKPTDVGNSSQTGALPSETVQGFTKLATDLVQGTPFEALGKVFMPGTATIKQPDQGGPKGFAIKPGAQIKVPALPPVKPVTTTTTGPMAGPTAGQTVQTGSTAPQGTTSQTQTGSTQPYSYYHGK